jgi:hypothetical protein
VQDAQQLTDVRVLGTCFTSLAAGNTLRMEQQSLAMASKPSTGSDAGLVRATREIVPVAQTVTKENIDAGLFQLRDGPPESSICRISGSRTTLEGVTIELLSGDDLQCLILEHCDTVCLRDVHFKGVRRSDHG